MKKINWNKFWFNFCVVLWIVFIAIGIFYREPSDEPTHPECSFQWADC